MKKKNKKTLSSSEKLMALFGKIPSTKGCMENLAHCKSYCCQLQTPQLLKCEFLNTWNYIFKEWPLDDIVSLIERCLRTYLENKPTKGCILWDENTKLCRCHRSRPYACRVYGIEPDEMFKPKYEKLCELYKDVPDAIFRYQCNLVSVIGDKQVTPKDMDRCWDKLIKIEKSIGIKDEYINDGPNGTYRTYHDHILLHLFPEQTMENLTSVRLYGTDEEKNNLINTFIPALRDAIQQIMDKEKK